MQEPYSAISYLGKMPIAFTGNGPYLRKQQILHNEHTVNSNMILSCAYYTLCLDTSIIINSLTPGLPQGLKKKGGGGGDPNKKVPFYYRKSKP